METFFQSNPQMKERVEQQLAKLTPEQRQWFVKNQGALLARLQQAQIQNKFKAASTAVTQSSVSVFNLYEFCGGN